MRAHYFFARRGFGGPMRVAFLIGIHLVDASIYERYTRSDAK